jgi:hypothetical protein
MKKEKKRVGGCRRLGRSGESRRGSALYKHAETKSLSVRRWQTRWGRGGQIRRLE